jgi:hypothetical protein
LTQRQTALNLLSWKNPVMPGRTRATGVLLECYRQTYGGDAIPVQVTEATDRALEREANVFAMEFAIPEPLVRQQWSGHPTVREMVWRYQVSEPAMH